LPIQIQLLDFENPKNPTIDFPFWAIKSFESVTVNKRAELIGFPAKLVSFRISRNTKRNKFRLEAKQAVSIASLILK
jgi:hypothetical protein